MYFGIEGSSTQSQCNSSLHFVMRCKWSIFPSLVVLPSRGKHRRYKDVTNWWSCSLFFKGWEMYDFSQLPIFSPQRINHSPNKREVRNSLETAESNPVLAEAVTSLLTHLNCTGGTRRETKYQERKAEQDWSGSSKWQASSQLKHQVSCLMSSS